MKNLLKFIVSKIIDDDKDVEIEEIQGESRVLNLIIKAPKEKIGSLVGKNGRIINSIRNVMKIAAVKKNILLAGISIEENEIN